VILPEDALFLIVPAVAAILLSSLWRSGRDDRADEIERRMRRVGRYVAGHVESEGDKP
jgi:hypothetical protein